MKAVESTSNKVLGFVKGLLLWCGGLTIWFWYTFNTLDRSASAYAETGGTGPMLSGYSIVILGVLLSLLLSRYFFSRKKSIGSVSSKVFVVLIVLFGLYLQLSYDPSLSKLRAYRDSRNHEFTGVELFDVVNAHRASIGVQKLELEETFCGNLVERWMAIKTPDNGHKGFKEWWLDKNLKKDPYGQINELYGTGSTAEQVIREWTQSPGHKLPLEDPKYNVGCTYASGGLGLLIIGEKPSSK